MSPVPHSATRLFLQPRETQTFPLAGMEQIGQAPDHDLSLGTGLTSSCENRGRRDVGKIYYLYANLNYQLFKILFRYCRTASQLPSEWAGFKFQVGKIHMQHCSLYLGSQLEHWLAGRNINHPPNYSWSSNTLKAIAAFFSAEQSELKAVKDPNLFVRLQEKPKPLFPISFHFRVRKITQIFFIAQ